MEIKYKLELTDKEFKALKFALERAFDVYEESEWEDPELKPLAKDLESLERKVAKSNG